MMSWRRSYSGGGAPQGFQDTRGSKGLINQPGQNNCFLNSALQVLWHLDIFRRSFRQMSSHRCSQDSCVFCALKSIFSELQCSSRSVLPSDPLRTALALAFSRQQRFQLGGMDDAAECFENILMRIHFHMSEESSQDISSSPPCSSPGSSPCSSPLCIPHQKFSMRLYEQCVCSSCGASSDPLPFIQMIHYISTTSLCNQAVEMLKRRSDASPAMFGELLRNASSVGDLRNCPAGCGSQQPLFRVLLNSPEVVTIGLVWDSATSDLAGDLIHALGTRLRLGDLFGRVEQVKARAAELYLVGLVCYYGRHYSSFFYHTRTRRWMYCDDEKVTEVGPRWRDVVWRCIRGRYQPLLLLYADPRGAAVVLHPPGPPDPPARGPRPPGPADDSEDSGRDLSVSSDTRTDSSTDSCSRPPSRQTNTGEPLKDHQAACPPPRSSSSSSSSSSSRRLRDFKETMTSIIHSRPLSCSSSSSLPSSFPTGPAPKGQDWETDSCSSEWRASERGGRGVWRPKREGLNIDGLFSRERRRQAGYSPLGAPLLEDPPPAPHPGPYLNPNLKLSLNLKPNPNPNPNPGPGPNPNHYPIFGPGHNQPTLNSSSNTMQGGGGGRQGGGGGRQGGGGGRQGGGGIQRTESGYESSERNSSPVDRPPGPLGLQTPCRSSGRSELDELQDEVWKRAREEEEQTEREREREAAMGFNPTPSKVLDLDQLQIQGTRVRADRCVSEAELHLDQSVRLEKAGEVAAALSVVNEAVTKLTSTLVGIHPSNQRRRTGSQARLQGCLQRARNLQQRMLLQQEVQQKRQQEVEQKLLQEAQQNLKQEVPHKLQQEVQLKIHPDVLQQLQWDVKQQKRHQQEVKQQLKLQQNAQQKQKLPNELPTILSQENVYSNKNHQYHHGYGQQPQPFLLLASAGFLEEAELQLPQASSSKPVLLQVLLTDRQEHQAPHPADSAPIRLAPTGSPRENSRGADESLPPPPPGHAPPTGHTHKITDMHSHTQAPPTFSSAPPPFAMATMSVEHRPHDDGPTDQSQDALRSSAIQDTSELDALYQASLRAPSMQRGSSNRASRSKMSTAEMEKYPDRTPPTLQLQGGFHDDEDDSAESLRRTSRRLRARARPDRYRSSPPPPAPPTAHLDQTDSSPELRNLGVARLYITSPGPHPPRSRGPEEPHPPPSHSRGPEPPHPPPGIQGSSTLVRTTLPCPPPTLAPPVAAPTTVLQNPNVLRNSELLLEQQNQAPL